MDDFYEWSVIFSVSLIIGWSIWVPCVRECLRSKSIQSIFDMCASWSCERQHAHKYKYTIYTPILLKMFFCFAYFEFSIFKWNNNFAIIIRKKHTHSVAYWRTHTHTRLNGNGKKRTRLHHYSSNNFIFVSVNKCCFFGHEQFQTAAITNREHTHKPKNQQTTSKLRIILQWHTDRKTCGRARVLECSRIFVHMQ